MLFFLYEWHLSLIIHSLYGTWMLYIIKCGKTKLTLYKKNKSS